MSDIQQHQHRFASQNQLFNPNTKAYGQKIAQNIVIEPSVQTQLPSETALHQLSHQQNPFFVNQPNPQQQALQGRFRNPNNLRQNDASQHHTQTNFIPNYPTQNVVFPQQPLFDRNVHQPQQQVFQRSVANQQGDPNRLVFKPSQPFPLQPPQIPNHEPQNSFGQQNSLQPVQTLQQNQMIHQQTNFPSNNQLPPIPNQPYQIFQNPQVKQQSQLNPAFYGDIRPDDPRYKELLEREKIIQKHAHFVQRQNEKQQTKVRQLHQEFVQKQRRIKEQSIANNKPNFGSNGNYFPSTRGRLVSPYELSTFERAVKNYEEIYPTSSPKPISITTAEPYTNIEASASNRVKASRSNIYGEASNDELDRLLVNQREKLFNQLKQDVEKPVKKGKAKPTKAISRDDLLRQLKLALAEQPADLGNQNYTSMDLVLPDGQKVQVIRTTDPNLVKGATPLNADGTILTENSAQKQDNSVEQKPLIEQVADSSIIPPGSNFEVIRQSADGNLQSVGSLPNKKKVTFVYLEEQNDGSYKVQGVKSNGEKEAKTKGTEVDSIINRIKNGEIQLPPTSNRRNLISSSTTVYSSSPAPNTQFIRSNENDHSTTQIVSSVTPAPTYSYSSSAPSYATSYATEQGSLPFEIFSKRSK